MISIAPDGNYYTWSKLYKIEALVNPKILEIKETKYPNFILKIEEVISMLTHQKQGLKLCIGYLI